MSQNAGFFLHGWNKNHLLMNKHQVPGDSKWPFHPPSWRSLNLWVRVTFSLTIPNKVMIAELPKLLSTLVVGLRKTSRLNRTLGMSRVVPTGGYNVVEIFTLKVGCPNRTKKTNPGWLAAVEFGDSEILKKNIGSIPSLKWTYSLKIDLCGKGDSCWKPSFLGAMLVSGSIMSQQ